MGKFQIHLWQATCTPIMEGGKARRPASVRTDSIFRRIRDSAETIYSSKYGRFQDRGPSVFFVRTGGFGNKSSSPKY